MTRVSVTFDDELYEALATEAEDSGRSLARVVRDRLREGLFGAADDTAGGVAERLLLDGLSNEEVARRVRDAVPGARTTVASVSWLRSRMRAKGMDVPTQVAARRESS